MTIETDISIDDYKAFLKFLRQANFRLTPLGFGAAVIFGAVFVIVLGIIGLHIDLPSLLGGIILCYILLLLYSRGVQKKLYPQRNGFALGKQTIEIAQEGIHVTKEHIESFFKWPGVISVEEANKHFLIMIDRNAAIIIPKRSFFGEEQIQEFKNLLSTNSIARNIYLDKGYVRQTLWLRRILRVTAVVGIIILIYSYTSRPRDEISLMNWEYVGVDSNMPSSHIIKFTCVSDPSRGFIGYTPSALNEMLDDSGKESIKVRVKKGLNYTTVPYIEGFKVPFIEIKNLDSSNRPFVKCSD